MAESKQSEKKRKCLTDVFSRLRSCDDGDVWAMDARQHAEQHPDPRQHQESCARCRFLARRHLWEDIGSSRLPGQSDKVKLRWLAERPRQLASSSGSKWGIGCMACANLMSRMGGETKGIKLRVGTKWATFSVRSWSNMQAESIKLLCLEFGKFSVSWFKMSAHEMQYRFFSQEACQIRDPQDRAAVLAASRASRSHMCTFLRGSTPRCTQMPRVFG